MCGRSLQHRQLVRAQGRAAPLCGGSRAVTWPGGPGGRVSWAWPQISGRPQRVAGRLAGNKPRPLGGDGWPVRIFVSAFGAGWAPAGRTSGGGAPARRLLRFGSLGGAVSACSAAAQALVVRACQFPGLMQRPLVVSDQVSGRRKTFAAPPRAAGQRRPSFLLHS